MCCIFQAPPRTELQPEHFNSQCNLNVQPGNNLHPGMTPHQPADGIGTPADHTVQQMRAPGPVGAMANVPNHQNRKQGHNQNYYDNQNLPAHTHPGAGLEGAQHAMQSAQPADESSW